MITKEQVKNEIDTLENEQTLEMVYQLIQNIKQSSRVIKKHSKEAQQKALAEFCGSFDGLHIDEVENTFLPIENLRLDIFYPSK